jgi:uncharacterized protein (DUF58 family)
VDVRLGPAAPAAVARAARILWVRSRREATSWLVGGYRSAFRGGGVEFEELRSYEPGDDVRSIDWNATARSGTPWVKRFREERAHTVLVALDVSASMAFASHGRSKLATAAHAAALITAAAQRAGDRVALAAFSDTIRAALPPARGAVHGWRLVRLASEQAEQPGGSTRIGVACAWALAQTRRRAIVVLLSDFRDPAVDRALAGAGASPLAALASRHDVVAVVVDDPREHALVAAGAVRLGHPEAGGPRRLLGTSRRRRALYASAAADRREALLRRLRREGADPLTLSAPEDPLRALVRFFHVRAERGRRTAQ